LTRDRIKGIIAAFESGVMEFEKRCKDLDIKPFEWHGSTKIEDPPASMTEQELIQSYKDKMKKVNAMRKRSNSLKRRQKELSQSPEKSFDTRRRKKKKRLPKKRKKRSTSKKRESSSRRASKERKYNKSMNLAIDPTILRDRESLSPGKRYSPSKNERTNIRMVNGDKILPSLENVKRMHKLELEDEIGRKTYVDDPEYIENQKTDFDDTDLLFGRDSLGLGLEPYADLLEQEKRIGVYYKSYLDRFMRDKPKDWVEKIPERMRLRKTQGKESLPPGDNSDLWHSFIGGFTSGRPYVPGVRLPNNWDDLTPEERWKYLFNTDYKPPFDEYVKYKDLESLGKKARDLLERSKSPNIHRPREDDDDDEDMNTPGAKLGVGLSGQKTRASEGLRTTSKSPIKTNYIHMCSISHFWRTIDTIVITAKSLEQIKERRESKIQEKAAESSKIHALLQEELER